VTRQGETGGSTPSRTGSAGGTGSDAAPGQTGGHAAAGAGAGPFVFAGCEPHPPACARRPTRGPVRVTKTVVRPARKNGGTILVFRLSRPTVLQITVVRVYPTCERVGRFTVRGRAGLNRIRFRGRLGGRALPSGGYRLVVRSRGAKRDAAAVPIVIARGAVSATALRKMRYATRCSEAIANLAFQEGPAPANARSGDGASRGGVLGTIAEQVTEGVASAAGAVAGAARKAKERLSETSNDPSSFVLALVGTIALASAILGGIVLMRIIRSAAFRDFYY
jgi:hypothetical protein